MKEREVANLGSDGVLVLLRRKAWIQKTHRLSLGAKRHSEIQKLSISSTSPTYLEPSVRLNAAPRRQLLTSVPMGERRCCFGPQTLP
jgi:hypothetical protein